MPSTLHRTLRSLLPAPVRASYWQMRTALHRRRIAHGQVHERHVCRALRGMIQRGDVCIDVGANVGLLSIFMANHAGPSGHVYAFELFEDNVASLKRNVEASGLTDRVSVTHAAVSDGSQDELTFYAGRNRSNAEWNVTGLDADGEPAEAVATVKAVTLDAALKNLARVDVIKIDVEGAEAQVLAGMGQVIAKHRPAFLIECHSSENWIACAKLVEAGYTLYDTHGETLDPQADYPASHLVVVPTAEVSQRSA